MSKKRITMNEQVRRAIRQSGVSRYAILKACGLDVRGLSPFMKGKRGLNLKTVDALADVLGLTLVVRGPVRVSPPAKPGRKPKAKKGGGS